MFVVNWFWSVLNYLGLGHKSGKLLFLGLDNAGKTTLLQMLKDQHMRQHQPTIHPTSEELVIGKIRFTTYDLGGHTTARKIWSNYCAKCDGIVFLVDAAEPERFPEAKKELHKLLSDENLTNVPFLILGNKIDKTTAVGEGDLLAQLGLLHHTTGKESKAADGDRRPIELFMCSIMMKMGYKEGFRWLGERI